MYFLLYFSSVQGHICIAAVAVVVEKIYLNGWVFWYANANSDAL